MMLCFSRVRRFETSKFQKRRDKFRVKEKKLEEDFDPYWLYDNELEV